jgi:hypothetical protein
MEKYLIKVAAPPQVRYPCTPAKLSRFEVGMLCQFLLFLWAFLLDVVVISRLTDEESDLEILLLRQ